MTRPAKLLDVIKTIAQMRERYQFDDNASFLTMEDDPLTRMPKLTLKFFDEDTSTEVTLGKVIKGDV